MYARSTTVQAQSTAIDAGIADIRDHVLPALLAMPGCVGLSLMVDRESGRCIATSAWETAATMRDSARQVQTLREAAARAFGGRTCVDEWEIAVLHRGHHAGDGACVRATWLRIQPAQFDRAIEEAAMDLGSRPWQVLFDITLPVISPAIMSGWLLAFTISLDDVVITSFTTGPGSTTLPLLIWSKVKLGVTPDINALATLMVVAVGLGVIVAGIIMNRAEARRLADERLAYRTNG